MDKIAAYILSCCLFLMPAMVLHAQNQDMFIQQIAGKKIVRQSFDEKGNLIGKQEFMVGNMQLKGKSYYVNIETKIYDEKQRLKSTYSTAYRCKPDESNVLLSVFTINPKKKKIAVSVKSGEFKNIYELGQGAFETTLSFNMYVESGILNFLGSKNVVTNADRSKSENNDQIIISGSLKIKAYLLGIRIKTINYSTTEILNKKGFLQRQVFKESDGSYFTMNYQ